MGFVAAVLQLLVLQLQELVEVQRFRLLEGEEFHIRNVEAHRAHDPLRVDGLRSEAQRLVTESPEVSAEVVEGQRLHAELRHDDERLRRERKADLGSLFEMLRLEGEDSYFSSYLPTQYMFLPVLRRMSIST